MKILYVAPEHVSGGFELFVEGHRRQGNAARYVTFFRNLYGFPEDLCFDLLGMPVHGWVKFLKRKAKLGDQVLRDSKSVLPYREVSDGLESTLYQIRDFLNRPRIEKMIDSNGLDEFDIYHFEQGADPYRDSRWVRRLAARGKPIVCFYHGTDIRDRGIFRDVHRVSQLNLTSEIDLLPRIPGMKYLYLPIDTTRLKPSPRPADGRIRISHAARNRSYKGSDQIERIVLDLSKQYPIDWVMIENRTHKEALALKATSDIFIDQITDLGGWGYGASSVESLALGLPTVTRINEKVADFLVEHPFISADGDNLKSALISLIEDNELRRTKGMQGREWVVERHGLDAVMKQLYLYYSAAGII